MNLWCNEIKACVCLKVISYATPVYVHIWPVLVNPLVAITVTLSLFITLAIAIER